MTSPGIAKLAAPHRSDNTLMAGIFRLLAPLLLLPSLALAELDCVVPTREEGFDVRRPGAGELRRAARAIEAIVKGNGRFMNGNEPVRVRTSISYYGDEAPAASVITTAYNRKAWVGGGCQVSQFADRGGGLADGQIAVYINDPDAMLGGMVGDAGLPARISPTRAGSFAGFPLYGRGGDAADTMVMMTSSEELPWVAVTIAEALDWREREIAAREADWQKQSGSAGRGEAQLRAALENMIKMNPAEAGKMRARMERDLERLRADEARAHSMSNESVARTRSAFDAYRASFSAAQLKAPATLSGELFQGAVPRVDDPKGRPIVKVSTSVAQRTPGSIRLLVIPQYSVATDEDHEWQVASRNALDYEAIAALLDK
jgi:hypothetical protein